jgi:hypothetical protein
MRPPAARATTTAPATSKLLPAPGPLTRRQSSTRMTMASAGSPAAPRQVATDST